MIMDYPWVANALQWLDSIKVPSEWVPKQSSVPLIIPGAVRVRIPSVGPGIISEEMLARSSLFPGNNLSPQPPAQPITTPAPVNPASKGTQPLPLDQSPSAGGNATSAEQQQSPAAAMPAPGMPTPKSSTSAMDQLDGQFAGWPPEPTRAGYQPPRTYSADVLSTGYIDEDDHSPDSFEKSEGHIAGDIAALLAHHALMWLFRDGKPLQLVSIDKSGFMADEAGGIQHVSQLISGKNGTADALRIELPKELHLTQHPWTGTLGLADIVQSQSASGGGGSSTAPGSPNSGTQSQQPGQTGATAPAPTGASAAPPAPAGISTPPASWPGIKLLPNGKVDPTTLPPPGPVKPNKLTPDERKHILPGYVRPNGSYAGGHKYGTGVKDKSEFPSSWSDDKVLGEVQDVKDDPNSVTMPRPGGGFNHIGIRDGVEITVGVRADGSVATAFPSNLPRNP